MATDDGAAVDLDDLLEDLWEDAARGAKQRIAEARTDLARRRRMPGFRQRVRTAMLYGSAGWVATFGSLGIGLELALDGGLGTALALLCGGIALPAVGTGLWAWRGQHRDAVLEREALASRRAKQERAELPADVTGDWVRLRRAQALVVDLAAEGLVEETAVVEAGEMVEQLRVLLVADRRAAELGASPSTTLRAQVGEVADLLVALAAEAVQHRTAQVGDGRGPATLVDGRDKLASLRAARAEVARAEQGGDAAAAAAWIEREVDRGRARRAAEGSARATGTGGTGTGGSATGGEATAEGDRERRQQPG